MSKKHVFKSGDYFALGINRNRYVLGRVLLNIEEECEGSNLIDYEKSTFYKSYCALGNAILIELYDNILENAVLPESPLNIAIPYVFVDNTAIDRELWLYLGNKDVDPLSMDFPEIVMFEIGKGYCFTRGEISIRLKGEEQYWTDKLAFARTPPEIQNSLAIRNYILYRKGMFQDIYELVGLPNFPIEKFKRFFGDLKYEPELRKEIYSNIEEDPHQSYYEMALKHGHDIRRFFTIGKQKGSQ